MKNVFDVHPTVNELLVFEDGTCFFNDQAGKCGANDYAKTTGKKFELVTRQEEETTTKKTKK